MMISNPLNDVLATINRQPFLTDSGLETTLVFEDGIDLPCFAAFTLLQTEAGRQRLQRYYRTHLQLAAAKGLGFILETPTWRANSDWAQRLNLTSGDLQRLNQLAVSEMRLLQTEADQTHTLISGCIGPRGDGYNPEFLMSADAAQAYHQQQIGWFADAGVDMVSAMTLCYPEEAIGITRAAQSHLIPVVISFTVETDGKLVNGQSLGDVIAEVDDATGQGPLYYMVNCAHPSHFENELQGATWLSRIRGIRANASCKSHAELDESVELDSGDPQALGQSYRQLQSVLPRLAVYGGCCGTDHRHIAAISQACFAS
ncbi:MAG: homocysteine S-methyltransferase family protein [Pseudomonadota bacterium]|nr:homocysteine S-methyltransferase family protein [Pseudomonadota bacterium]